MEFAGNSGGATVRGNIPAAPFVLKTYKIVSDPANAAIISWGKTNNSFIVFDPFAFSQSLLPAHFKHSNFSSFVRQLNTYGFRKIDPDRWEFAHVSFLRDRTELLWQIERRRKKRDGEMDGGDEAVAMEVVGLKKEQMAIDDRLERLWARVRETEIRRRQMIGFLAKVFEAPLGFLTARDEIGEEGVEWEKKARRRVDAFPVDNGF